MSDTRLALLAAAFTSFGVIISAQHASKPASKASLAAGAELFHERCAACHGVKGDGESSYESGTYLPPRQPSPPDLTALSRENGGVFPADRVRVAIHDPNPNRTIGASDMPGWGNAFYGLGSNPGAYDAAVRNITAYIESIQRNNR